MDHATQLALVEQTLDVCGIESGPLVVRLAVLRGVAQAIGLRSRRMPSVPLAGPGAEEEGPAAQESPAGPTTAPAGRTTVEPLSAVLAAAGVKEDPEVRPATPAEVDALELAEAEQRQGTPAERPDPVSFPAPDPRQIAKAAKADAKAAADAARRAKWDPSWHDERERAGFFQSLANKIPPIKGKDADALAAFCESKGRPRPSAMTHERRQQLLGKLEDPEFRADFAEFCGRSVGDPAVEAELDPVPF